MKDEKIKLDPNNARVHDDANKRLIEKSLTKFGAGRSIVIDNDDYIIAGNGVFEQAEKLNIPVRVIETTGDELIAIKRTDLNFDDAERTEFAIADNAVGDSSIFDYSMIDDETLEEWEIELPDDDVEELEAKEDDYVAPAEIQTDIVKGDLFEFVKGDLRHRLLCGDSTSVDDVDKLMDGGISEMLFTSPPYSDMRDYNGGKDLSISNLIDFIPTWMPFVNYQVVNLGMKRKDNEIVQYWDEYIMKATDCGYKFLSWNIWNREDSGTIANQTSMFSIWHEWLFVFGKERKPLNRTVKNKLAGKKPGLSRRVGDLMVATTGPSQIKTHKQLPSVTTIQPNRERVGHPASFPVELPSEYIKAMTNETDIVTESFLGSGTTMVASHQLNRNCYGMELDEKYCQLGVDRMLTLDKDIKLFRNGIDVTEEYRARLNNN